MRTIMKLTVLLLSISAAGQAQTGVYAGLTTCNNSWENNWIITPAPELVLTGRYLALSLDGTFGTFTPAGSPDGAVFRSRASMVPMLRLPFLKSMFVTAGYGLAHVFTRTDPAGGAGDSEVTNEHAFKGEMRFTGGFGFSLGRSMSMVIKGGYSRISEHNYCYTLGAGLLLKPPASHAAAPVRPVVVPDMPEAREPLNVPVPEKPAFQPAPVKERVFVNAAVIHTTDPVISEFNMFLEALLTAEGVELQDWSMVRLALNREGVYAGDTAGVARLGNEQFGLDAVIETHVRYFYKSTFGGDVIVNHAGVRVLGAKDGRVLSAVSFDKKGADFAECKEFFKHNVQRIIFGSAQN